MGLPNPDMDFTSFDVLTASQMDDLVENIEALQDLSAFDAGSIPISLLQYNPAADLAYDFVASGCVWSGDSYASTLNGSMTSGVVYLAGKRLTVSSVTAHAFTASKDTYVYVRNAGNGTATVIYNAVNNNVASPAMTAGDMLIGIIVSGSSSIANVGSINQGQEDKRVPVASSVYYTVSDSLGNLICPRDPTHRTLGIRYLTSDQSTAGAAAIGQLSCPVIVPNGRKVKISIVAQDVKNTTAGSGGQVSIWRGAYSSGTFVAESDFVSSGASQNLPLIAQGLDTPPTSSVTYNGGFNAVTTSFAVIQATTLMIVELA